MNVNLTRAANAYRTNQNMLEGLGTAALQDDKQETSFSSLLGNALSEAVDTGLKAEKMQMQAITGEVELADLVTAIAEAELTINTVTAVRDRVIGAYQEIIRMPI